LVMPSLSSIVEMCKTRAATQPLRHLWSWEAARASATAWPGSS
jgi:hypothetical protein